MNELPCPQSDMGDPCLAACFRCFRDMDDAPQPLPAPAGVTHEHHAWWRLSSGDRVYAQAGAVFGLGTCLDAIEGDALVALAAVAWAREQAHQELLREHPRWVG